MTDPVRVESITLNVEPKVWYFRCRNDRIQARRPRAPERTMQAWFDRWQRRTRDTLTGSVHFEHAETGEDFMRNMVTYRMRVPRLVHGQDFGLPAIVTTPAQAIEFEAVDGRYVSRAEHWERLLS